ncbi:hypothetical protein MVEN_01325800 [Mycena venus]|uniref:DUF6533 domain-containing protein n=1 Tax=Mycena venus TaxID=2733690 RepID=A0A8H6Y1V1_9AGAR|nr:hypothetical protein MVEN_01325800 [Mycena venus]
MGIYTHFTSSFLPSPTSLVQFPAMLDDPVMTAQDDLATTIQALRTHDVLFVISITFLYFDHLITFGDEIRYLWKKTKTASTYSFLLNRYLAFFGDIAVTYFVFNTVPESWSVPPLSGTIGTQIQRCQRCKHVNLFRQLLLIFNQTAICRMGPTELPHSAVLTPPLSVLLTVRIYALYGRRTKVGVYMLGAGLTGLAISLWAISGKGGTPVPGVEGCHIANSAQIGIHLAVPWETLFLYDVIIFVALFYKSLKTRHESVTRRSEPLLSLLIRDGASYFVVMALINLANILTFYMAGPLLRGCLSTMASSLSVTMMSRMMLNLHAVESTGIFSTTAHIKYSSSLMSDEFSPVELDTLWTRDLERSMYVSAQSVDVSQGSTEA